MNIGGKNYEKYRLEKNYTKTLTSFDFKSVESAFGMPMRYANNSSHLVACLEKSKLMLDDIFQEKINFLKRSVLRRRRGEKELVYRRKYERFLRVEKVCL